MIDTRHSSRKSEILMFIYLTFDQCSRGKLYQFLELHFLFILFTQCLFKQCCKKWKLRCKYCILKWRVWKLHIHARVVNIFGSGLKRHYPVLSDLPISFKNASNFAKCKTFDRDKALIWFQYLQYLFLNTSVEKTNFHYNLGYIQLRYLLRRCKILFDNDLLPFHNVL